MNTTTTTTKPAAWPRTVNDAREAFKVLRYFMAPGQLVIMADLIRGEEGQFFIDKACELAERIQAMPKTYEQDGLGDESIAFLHYFAGGQASWWITEKDMGTEEDRNMQHQAFGLADLFNDGGELGYISIVELQANEAELDFYFDPKPLAWVRREREALR